MKSARWTRKDFSFDPISLAPRLIGARLVRILDDNTRLSGIIVETEAYLGIKDTCAHTFGGRRSPRNESMYAIPGTLYVYFTYGMHHCMNIVCGKQNEPVAVLLRAIAPEQGHDHMRKARTSKKRQSPLRNTDLCSGPGKLTQALTIDRKNDAIDLTTHPQIFIERNPDPVPPSKLRRTPRIGVGDTAPWAQKPLRWCLAGSPHLSRPCPISTKT